MVVAALHGSNMIFCVGGMAAKAVVFAAIGRGILSLVVAVIVVMVVAACGGSLLLAVAQ